MSGTLQRLAREPAAIGAIVASVLPALVALGVLTLDEQAIGALVVAVNTSVGVVVRLVVTPSAAQVGTSAPPAAADEPQPSPAG